MQAERLVPVNTAAHLFGESRATFYRKRPARIAAGLEESVEDGRKKYTVSSINQFIRKSVNC